jgi:peptide deformylase
MISLPAVPERTALMRILLYPDPDLRRPAEPVARVDTQLRRLVRQMFVALYDAGGVGLAAVQVGRPLRLFILSLTGERDGETVLINPWVLRQEGEQVAEEGCLSLPGVTAKLRRPLKVVVCGYDLEGSEVELRCEELSARAVGHEMDHLDGQLIIDRMGPAARIGNRPRLKELEESYRNSAASVP